MIKDAIIKKLKEENARLKDEIIRIQYEVYKCKEVVINNR